MTDTDSHAEVFYVYEADVDLNPRIGPSSMHYAEKTTVPTPGENQNHCIAGAIHVRTGRLVWIEYHRKTPPIFAQPLECLRGQCRRVRPIVLIIDNYATHKNRLTLRWFSPNPQLQLLFQPTYCPWDIVIERLWKAVHDTVTHNHRCRSMYEHCQPVARFLKVAQPFPTNAHCVEILGFSYLSPAQ